MTTKQLLIGLFLIVVCINNISANKYSYSTSESTTMSAKTFTAGDTIILKNGNWADKTLIFRGNGTVSQPVVFMAEKAGDVLMTGSTTGKIIGKYVEVSGLYFTGNYTSNKRGSVFAFDNKSEYCRLTNSAINKYNYVPNSAEINQKWVSLYGANNRVDHCYFEGKENVGSVIVVLLVPNIAANHRIDHNYFYKRTSLKYPDKSTVNGQDMIRVGDSQRSMTYANCTVDNNFFEECDGEIEIISNKSCGNTYSNNVFYRCQGTLTLRHGNDCKVMGNYFIGGGLSNAGGVRIIGEDHLVYNNYFQDLYGKAFRSAISIYNGIQDSPLHGYYQSKRVKVLFNTFYNCPSAFYVGYNRNPELTLPPLSLEIAHNAIRESNDTQVGMTLADSMAQMSVSNNILYKGKFVNYTPATNEFLISTVDLGFQPSNSTYGIYKPLENSILNEQYKTSDFQELIKVDIEGKSRPLNKTVGAFEINGDATSVFPTPQAIGCSFIKKI